MSQQHDTTPLYIGLASMPWSIFNRPSIQLGALKGYLDGNSAYQTDLFHPYLHVAASFGTKEYHQLALNSWAGEALYVPLLFPDRQKSSEKLFYQECKTNKVLKKLHFPTCVNALQQSVDSWIKGLELDKYLLFGFSICFNQLLSSLYAAKCIKKIRPELPIVVGGSGCVGEIGTSLLQHFPQIDYVINGEGEEPLLQLADNIAAKPSSTALAETILNKKTPSAPRCSKGITDINSLPFPDYTPYFQEIQDHFPGNNFIPVLPLEFSRGCWWNRCTFCNLNLQWRGYRKKSATRMIEETQYLIRKHRCLDFCFTDNALPPKEADIFFAHMAKEKVDYDFFAELRVVTTPGKLQHYRQGGLSSIQVGIEALSSSLLQRMNKGTTCIENIAAMRQSAEAGITLDGNLICMFPGSSKREVEETLANLDFVLPFSPLAGASFFLGHGSPVAKEAKKYHILAITQHPKNKKLFPQELLKGMTMLLKGYRGDQKKQEQLWKPVYQKIRQWQHFHSNRKNQGPALSYRDGGAFLLIRQEQLQGPVLHHRLQGTSRKIYLFCRGIQDFKSIKKTFPKVSSPALRQFLHDLSDKKLLFQEDDRFLALAINPRNVS